ncbi:MAG: tRNA 2-selenouridine(34) synthase MnmH [Halothiobacillaceae bacterium]
MPEQRDDLQQLFLDAVPLLDVRAPVEFAQGAFPGAENLPLLTDEERHRVGIRYKEQGQDAAIALGYELVDPEEKARRIDGWRDFFTRHPDGALYCFRGGLRSRLTQQMLAQAGVHVPRVRGGYKAMRRFLIDNLETIGREQPLLLLGGRTGVGKTDLLNRFDRAVDLEGIAAHRGSAFGKRAHPQPPQIAIENAMSIALLRQRDAGPARPILLEDEGRCIGSREIPLGLFEGMRRAPLILVETDMDARVEQGLKDYVLDLQAEYRAMLPVPEADEAFGEHLRSALARLQRRLGGERHKRYMALFEEALAAWLEQADDAGFREFIAGLLRDYYDPMYDYQIDRKRDRVVFRGDPEQVAHYLSTQSVELR